MDFKNYSQGPGPTILTDERETMLIYSFILTKKGWASLFLLVSTWAISVTQGLIE